MIDLSLLRALADQWPAPCTLKTVLVTSPAVATDFTLTPPGGSIWLLQSLSARIVTDANAANRQAALTLTDGTTTIYSVPPVVNITAGLTTDVVWLPGLEYASSAITGNKLAVGLPDIALPAGYALGPVTTNIQAGDQWSRIVAAVVEVWTGDIAREQTLVQTIADRVEALAEYVLPDNG